jgi:hypothetical protein
MADEDRNVDELLRILGDDGVNEEEFSAGERPRGIIGGYTPHFPTSKAALCWDCGQTIYLSNSWKQVERWPDVPVICLRCAVIRNEKEK